MTLVRATLSSPLADVERSACATCGPRVGVLAPPVEAGIIALKGIMIHGSDGSGAHART
jgi:hypothetical protein